MRVFALALAFTVVQAADAALAQAPAPQAPATQTPAAPAPAPAQTQPPTPRFEAGIKYAFLDRQRVAAFSAEGKVAAQRIETLQAQKQRELQDKQKALQAAQQKLDQSAGVLSEQSLRQQQIEIERQQRELARLTEDAQAELESLIGQVEVEFNAKLGPALERVAQQKQVHFILDVSQSGLLWAVPGMDLTAEVIAELDNPSAAAAPASEPPAIPAPPTVGSPQ